MESKYSPHRTEKVCEHLLPLPLENFSPSEISRLVIGIRGTIASGEIVVEGAIRVCREIICLIWAMKVLSMGRMRMLALGVNLPIMQVQM